MHQPKKDKDDEAVPSYLQYDKDECRKGLLRMIIKDELPFRVMEKEGFREFICVLQPRFQIPSVQNINYMCLTAHFIDENWNLQKKKSLTSAKF